MKIDKNEWHNCQNYEKQAWGGQIFITSTNGEVLKQNVYAKHMGIVDNSDFNIIDLNEKTILDVGCGPVSLLLRSKNFKRAVGVEPLFYHEDVDLEYKKNGIELIRIPAEEMNFNENEFDEVWMYNVLQHVYDPTIILNSIAKFGKTIRIFEWLDIPPHEGHPHCFNEKYFVDTLSLIDSDYKILNLNEPRLVGKAIVIVKTN